MQDCGQTEQFQQSCKHKDCGRAAPGAAERCVHVSSAHAGVQMTVSHDFQGIDVEIVQCYTSDVQQRLGPTIPGTLPNSQNRPSAIPYFNSMVELQQHRTSAQRVCCRFDATATRQSAVPWWQLARCCRALVISSTSRPPAAAVDRLARLAGLAHSLCVSAGLLFLLASGMIGRCPDQHLIPNAMRR